MTTPASGSADAESLATPAKNFAVNPRDRVATPGPQHDRSRYPDCSPLST
jgi:hypothetical protein